MDDGWVGGWMDGRRGHVRAGWVWGDTTAQAPSSSRSLARPAVRWGLALVNGWMDGSIGSVDQSNNRCHPLLLADAAAPAGRSTDLLPHTPRRLIRLYLCTPTSQRTAQGDQGHPRLPSEGPEVRPFAFVCFGCVYMCVCAYVCVRTCRGFGHDLTSGAVDRGYIGWVD